MNELTVINPETGEISQWQDHRQEIIGVPIRATWDVRDKKPRFVCDEGESEEIGGNLVSASYLYACWTDIIGQPSCMGVGSFCPDHPDHSDKGIGLVLETYQLGTVYMQCFGLLRNWAVGLCRRAEKQNGDFSTKGVKVISTKHGEMRIPGLE